jgi:aminopeptidase
MVIADFDKKLKAYAELLIKRGVNLRSNQVLLMAAPLEGAHFAHIVMEAAWAAGAKDVIVRWGDNTAGELRLRHAALQTLTDIPAWLADSYNSYATEDCVFLALDTEYPPPQGLDPEKMSASRLARMQATEPFTQARMKGVVRWCIGSVATVGWASLVYPELSADEGLAALWHEVLFCTRCLEDDPVAAWDVHIARTNAYRDKLNAARFTELHFVSELGTDLRVGLPEGYRFAGSQETDSHGDPFIANMPSEEIFSAPHRERVEGVVVASKPLFYNNTLIEGLRFTFSKGKVVDFSADTGTEIIGKLLATDEGSSYLGEVALVSYDSTVSQTGKLFYTTLYDENAACHLALGASYPESISGGLTMSREELQDAGMNQSFEHVDFMFGTAGLTVVGVDAVGNETRVFEKGVWAF